MDFPRRPRRRTAMELTPLIDVVFQLLVFFLLTSSFVRPSLRLDLPRASVADEAADEPVALAIDAGGEVSLDGAPVTFAELESALRSAVAEGRRAVRLSGDAAMDYGLFVRALDAARRAGCAHFDLVHDGAPD